MTNLAIIIPYYKLSFFRETLESLAEQTDQRFHVYIGNDASLENPEDLLKEFEGKFNFTYKKFEKNLGGTSLTKQWERCIELIRDEEWIMVLGDDDILGNNVVESFYLHLKEASQFSNVVRFATQVIDEHSNPISKILQQPKLESSIDCYYRKHIGENRGSLSEFIFRYIKYKQYKFRNFDLGWSADDFAVIDISENKPIYSINDEIVYFRKSQINITGQKDNIVRKNNAMLQSTTLLLKLHFLKLNKAQRILFIKLYDNLILGSSKIKIKQFFHLQWLTIHYLGFRMFANQWKSIFYRWIK